MAKLVGIPCGVATKLVLNGTINDKGVIAPMNTKINTPLIEELKKLGIECKEELV
jgi:saccharopine dehydrogenase (NADP+, L-glutamate forming)